MPPFRHECRGPSRTSPHPRTKAYAFHPVPLFPIRRGPMLADRPRTGSVRTPGDVQRVLEERLPLVEACWRWAATRGAMPTALDVALTIDPFGDTHDIAIASTRQADASLLACVRAQYTGMTSPRIVSHATRVTAQLAFERVEQPPLRKGEAPPARPPGPPPPEPRTEQVCTPVLVDATPNTIAVETPIVVLDLDPQRSDRMTSAQRGLLAAQVTGRGRCRARDQIEPDKVRTREAMMANHGAYQACFADARERDPSLTGEVTLKVLFAQPGGTPSTVAATGAGDAAFHACLVAAASELWLQPPALDALDVEWPMQLNPPPSPVTVGDFLSTGDPAGALARLEQQLRREPSPIARCTAHAQVVLATAQLAPWLDDDRMRVAIENLAAALKPLPEHARTACMATGTPLDNLEAKPLALLLQRLARVTKYRAKQPYATTSWLRRYGMVMPLAPYLPWGPYLRWNHALALAAVDRDAGRQALVALEDDPEIGTQVTETVARLDQALDALDALCP